MTDTFTRDPRPRIQYTGDGIRTDFEFPYPVLASDDLLAYLDQLPATGFSITGLGDPDGVEVTFADPPEAGVTVTLLRRTEAIRETEFVDGGPFRAAAINAELDRIMYLVQEDREEMVRSLRGQPYEGSLDYCLPAPSARANKLLGFDSSGTPAAYGTAELPTSGDASGSLVTANGGNTARTLGEHLAAVVNVRDYGAMGDGVTDDEAAFTAAIAAADSRDVPVYVPAGPTAYVLGNGLTLDGVQMMGDGPGSLLQVGLGGGYGIRLQGRGARLSGVRILGPGANAWPASATDVTLSGVSGDGVLIGSTAVDTALAEVEVAACENGIGVVGGLCALVGCSALFHVNGIEFRAGASGPVHSSRTKVHGCTIGLRVGAAATIEPLAVAGLRVSSCGKGIELNGHATAWRSVEIANVAFSDGLDTDLEADRRQSVALRGCHLDESGKRSGAPIDLLNGGETAEAPNLIVESTRAETVEVVNVQLSGGTNLNLLVPGDLIVLASDADDIDDLWTALKATRGGVVQAVNAQTVSTADLELARATTLPLVTTSDVIRVVGRAGTSTVATVGAAGPAVGFTWLQAEDHCRVFAVHDPMAAGQIALAGSNGVLHRLPGLGGEPTQLAGVEIDQGALNGAFMRLVTFDLADDTAASFTPDSTIGMVMAFGHGSLGDTITANFSYRADGTGYTELLAVGTTSTSDVEIAQLTALGGTTGSDGKLTYSTFSDGKIYVENRLGGPSRKVSLVVFGAPL
jgi:hypothetical protein